MQIKNELTYDQLGKILNISPNKAHLEVKRIYNIIIERMVHEKHINIWDSVVAIKDLFGMTEKEAVNKLNKKLRKELSDDAKSKYGDIRFKLKSKKTKI
jgi:hypothetical protein